MTRPYLQVLRVSGSPYELGLQIGRHFRDNIVAAIEESPRLKSLREWAAAKPAELDCFQSVADKRFPDYVAEIKGIADGCGVNYRDIALMNLMFGYPAGCSTVIAKHQGKIILGHNEDSSKEAYENSFLLLVKPEEGLAFFSFCYPGLSPGSAFSFNSAGLVLTCNGMPTPDPRPGVPRHLTDRHALQAGSIDEALAASLAERRACGFSHNLVCGERAVNLETTAQRHCVTETTSRFMHTNHYVSPGLGDIEQHLSGSTVARYEQGITRLDDMADATPEAVLETLSSRENAPNSIFADGESGGVYTICTALFEISRDAVSLKVYPGHVQKEDGEALTFSLDDLVAES